MKNMMLLLTFTLLGCAGSNSSPSGSAGAAALDPGSDPVQNPWNASYAKTTADLPTCVSQTNAFYYIEDQNIFNICKSNGWTRVDIKGSTTSVLKDANGIRLPGIAINNFGGLWNETEKTVTTYVCDSITCGMKENQLFFNQLDCAGTPHVAGYQGMIPDMQPVFQNSGKRYVVTGPMVSMRVMSTLKSGGVCDNSWGLAMSQTSSPVPPVALYTGDFQIAPNGPYSMTAQ